MSLATQIQERLKGILPELLGIQLVEVTPDRVLATLEVRPDLCTTGGILHGGSIMAFADTLGAVGTVVNMPPGHGTATIESKTNFIGGAALGTTVTGESTPVHKGRTTQVWQTRITNAEGKLVALVTQTQIVMPPRKEPPVPRPRRARSALVHHAHHPQKWQEVGKEDLGAVLHVCRDVRSRLQDHFALAQP
jgi:1,4-dihydroxy-2-naphthoyl-CoA hydrolase